MSTITVRDKALVTKHPDAKLVYTFDYDAENLGDGVTITTSTMTLSVVSGENTGTPASIDSVSIIGSSRKTTFRLIAGVNGTKYRVTNEIVTNETPAQTKVKYIDILVQQ